MHDPHLQAMATWLVWNQPFHSTGCTTHTVQALAICPPTYQVSKNTSILQMFPLTMNSTRPKMQRGDMRSTTDCNMCATHIIRTSQLVPGSIDVDSPPGWLAVCLCLGLASRGAGVHQHHAVVKAVHSSLELAVGLRQLSIVSLRESAQAPAMSRGMICQHPHQLMAHRLSTLHGGCTNLPP